MAEKQPNDKFTFQVPLDASGIEDFEPGQDVKVVVKDREGALRSQTVKFNRKGHGMATFNFSEHPGPLQVLVGPADASDEEMTGLQTINFNVSSRKWVDKPRLRLSPIVVPPYYWYWWLRWCRTFTIRGRVVCPDGSPVPGAEVCAYDVDWWFIHHSKQLVGCSTTDINGAFEITFRWCCGWWPWWWWRHRNWQLDPVLLDRVGDVLSRNPDLNLSRFDNQPSLAVFDQVMDTEDLAGMRSFKAADVNMLPSLRDQLLTKLPAAPELEALRIWPWHPWQPWWDCTPDIIFKVTQDCETPGEVILEEDIGDTRWNIPNPLNVNLVVPENACCLPPECPNPPCDGHECLILDSVCNFPFTQVGGNPGAAAAPEGYLNPGSVPADTHDYHRPFSKTIPIWKDPETLIGVDYYEIEYNDGTGWGPLPTDAALDFKRNYFYTGPLSPKPPPLFTFTNISGHNVVETRRHFETNNSPTWPDEPGATDAWWLSKNYNLLVPIDTTKFNDGTYRFRVVGWQESGGSLVNPVIIPVCGDQTENEFVLTFDNRVITPVAAHNPTHNCGEGVHLCTTEPDTHISAVRVDGVLIDPCDTVDITPGATLEVDFLAHDSDTHLAYYLLEASWGLNQSINLLDRPGAVVTSIIAGTPTGWAPGQTEGNYGTALTQGAIAPHWAGGQFRLTVPMDEAFLEPCCYQLELWAFKRTVVGSGTGVNTNYYSACNAGFHVGTNGNKTEYSIGVGVCPPSTPEPPIIEADLGRVVRRG